VKHAGKKRKARIVSFRIDEDDFTLLDALARQTSCSRGEVLRRCFTGAQLKNTIDARALTEVSRVHANLNRIGGLLKLAIREGVSDRSTFSSTKPRAHRQSLNQARQQRQDSWSSYQDTASRERRRLKEKYRNQRGVLAALPVSGHDRKRLSQQLRLRQAIESRALKLKLASQRKAIQKSAHPGTWRHFVASRAANRDARAIRLPRRREQQRGSPDLERG